MADKKSDRAGREAAGAKPAKADNKADKRPAVTNPVDVVDGIPDRSPRPATWKYILIGAIFAAWVGVLVYFLVAGPR